MFEKITTDVILGFAVFVFLMLFAFLTVASVTNIPGIKTFDGSNLLTTTVTLTAAIGGAAAAKFGGKGPTA